MTKYDKRLQPTYNIEVSVEYYDVQLKRPNVISIDIRSIEIYEVSKDSENFNYNIHLLTLSNISLALYSILKLESTSVIIRILEIHEEISNTSFNVIKLHELINYENIFNIQLVLISKYVYNFQKNNNYASVSAFDKNAETHVTSYELLSKILQKISSDGGKDVIVNSVNAGEIKKLYSSIRIPKNLKNFQIFDWLFKEYPPYVLSPYFIIDDFHFTDKYSSNITVFVLNICDINGSYDLKNYNKINGIIFGKTEFITSKPLMDYKKTYEELQATLMIKNNNENRLFELKPLLKSNRSDQVIQIDSHIGIADYKLKLLMKKDIAEYKSTIDTYKYDSIGLKDITFGSVYDITDPLKFHYLPISIYYKFIKNQDDTFELETTVDYIDLPKSLIGKKG